MAAGRTTLGMHPDLLEILLPGRRASNREIEVLQSEEERKVICALLPSPELLSIGSSSGSDKSNTLKDFYDFYSWAKRENLLPLDFTGKSLTITRDKTLEKLAYGSMIVTAFQRAFVPIRNAIKPEESQVVLLYYAGHGVDKSICDQHYSATPLLKMNGTSIYQRSDYIYEIIKGGELFLHHVGFCNLRALIQPWIVAVKEKSFNKPDQLKKNKHLVVILDSCHSGVLANDLKNMKDEADQPWNTHESCSVTVQASCGSDETVNGGYFTPLFLYLNSEGQVRLEELEKEWGDLCDEQKDVYKNLPGSSPTMSTTRPQPTDVPLFKMAMGTGQNPTLNLFPDSRFFKFCYQKVSLSLYMETPDGQRILVGPKQANEFLEKSNGTFRIIDYKLKMASNDTPLGLFLLDDTKNPWSKSRFCAHIHYSAKGTNISDVQCINLVHHAKEFPYSVDMDEETQGNVGKITVYKSDGKPNVRNAVKMAEACEKHVRTKKKHIWDDLSHWQMKESYETQRSKKLRTRHFSDCLSSLDIDIPRVQWCENRIQSGCNICAYICKWLRDHSISLLGFCTFGFVLFSITLTFLFQP